MEGAAVERQQQTMLGEARVPWRQVEVQRRVMRGDLQVQRIEVPGQVAVQTMHGISM